MQITYAAHAALRHAFNAVGATLPDAAPRAAIRQSHGRTWAARARAAVRPFLLERTAEARGLMDTL